MTAAQQTSAAVTGPDPRQRIIARLREHKQALLLNGWVVTKKVGGTVCYVVRWRQRQASGRAVQKSCYVGTHPKLADGAKRLLLTWRTAAGLVPGDKVRLGLRELKDYGKALQLHYRGQRRLGQLCRRIRATNDEVLPFEILRDDDGKWLEHLLWGRSWEQRERREGLVL